VSVLEFLSARSERQREAFEHIHRAIAAYDVECIDTLVGDIDPPVELMKTQTDRKIAEELQRTYDVQREAQVRRQALERETSIANMQVEVVRSEQAVRIAEREAEKRLLPAAAANQVAVLVMRPFERAGLFAGLDGLARARALPGIGGVLSAEAGRLLASPELETAPLAHVWATAHDREELAERLDAARAALAVRFASRQQVA